VSTDQPGAPAPTSAPQPQNPFNDGGRPLDHHHNFTDLAGGVGEGRSP